MFGVKQIKLWHSLAIIDAILAVYLIYFISFVTPSVPPQFAILRFPLLQQPNDITCGPTSAAMLLRFYNKNIKIDEIASKSKTTWFKYKGKSIGLTVPGLLNSVLKSYNLECKLKQGNLSVLKWYISQNRPPIVLLRSGKTLWHYVVAIGYDEKNILIADPGSGTQYNILQNTFLKAWDFSGDMDGKYYGQDFYRFMILMAEIQGRTYIVPVHATCTEIERAL
jgi:uncharacterized protein YvpB